LSGEETGEESKKAESRDTHPGEGMGELEIEMYWFGVRG
jgi:hypothetical protein